jgi:hypothetical protein
MLAFFAALRMTTLADSLFEPGLVAPFQLTRHAIARAGSAVKTTNRSKLEQFALGWWVLAFFAALRMTTLADSLFEPG